MSFDPNQLRMLIRLELAALNDRLLSAGAVELLMLTAAAETRCGAWLWQDDGDPEIEAHLAYGIFQMEGPAYADACPYIQKYRPGYVIPPRRRLITDLQLAIWAARCHYLKFIEPIPAADDVAGLAYYWKSYWNTSAGRGTVSGAMHLYEVYA